MIHKKHIAGGGDEDHSAAMLNAMGPMMVDQSIRHAISHCWMCMPESKRSVDAVTTEVRRIVERALKDLQEDASAFGKN